MPLIVAGDFTWPCKDGVRLDEVVHALSSSALVLNFEGAILDGNPATAAVVNDHKFNLFSIDDALGVLKRLNVVSLGLANNHIGDYKDRCASTLETFERAGIFYFGLQRCPFFDVQVDKILYRFIGVVSPLTDITKDRDGLSANQLDPGKVLRLIRDWRENSPAVKIVVFVHWGYELARCPLPADRAWAHFAIEAGADFVVGHHPHVVQGIERVGKGIVAYSLGNLVLPQLMYRDKHLSYSDPAVTHQLAMTLEDDPVLFWSRYVASEQSVLAGDSERLSLSARIADLTPFAGMSEREYRRWFRKARRSGATNVKGSLVVLWSYFGVWKLHYLSALWYLSLRRSLRTLLIRLGLHQPYNWG